MSINKTFALVSTCALFIPINASADFIADSKASVDLRNFYFNRDFRNGPPTTRRDSAQEWAQGAMLRFESGYTAGTVGLGIDALGMAGFKLDGGDGSGGTGLLPADLSSRNGRGSQSEYSKLELTAKAKVSETVLKVGSLAFRSPVVSSNDTRLLPSTFEGAMLTSKDIDKLVLQGGQLEQIKFNSSSNYQDFTGNRIGGVSDEFNFAGGTYNFSKTLSTSLYYGNLENVYRQFFGGVVYEIPLATQQSLKFDLRYSKSTEDGNFRNLENRAANGMVSYTLGSSIFSAAYQRMSGDDPFPYIANTDPYLVNFVQINDFANIEERSWQLRYDYNFAALGIPGLTFMSRYVSGDNVRVSGNNTGKEWERNTDIGYVIQSGTLKNVGIKLRNATVRSNFGNDLDETRLILSYTVALW
ncbi:MULTISPECIES: OprD family porin [Pseudomonas]|uniref:Protein OpdO n=1 Tax=Pseudomonas cichorii TaxID=36746 RepID=A0A3M4VEZ3_PSECI|nr:MULTISPECIES: OprD family porin [Pseudomonas]AHF69166.1 protein OpdO [Pseudomonas cichorii JBC1]QVE16128.1 OprD family porin [Pseudomonas cichorii]RMR50271.1 Protein OpdO [Pseudomonas cichorii]SDN19005.1 outer membrane porin, OprD family [Pseudomonas cichorii]GFM76770.1 pyroglutatmate porin [Pseudomonas cichorii]